MYYNGYIYSIDDVRSPFVKPPWPASMSQLFPTFERIHGTQLILVFSCHFTYCYTVYTLMRNSIQYILHCNNKIQLR
jgi:hypothetical protein